ncbi:GNAT family N-acetyltransferase [Arthrobacter sp. MYb213]|uniref:GNAT family N-acetyltransferase n=1 Tax=Arthrobacter sp. MYb213 TaxID=1848595 RepID=UPI000CFD71E5|nr:GNAT family N-acetyltransferase [Arthrobacter sp. MYb213]PRB71521.1 GNAT family N-acetyltransferase [Arthrobacter sp. MYb213]
MASNASDELIGTWVDGWAGVRGYEIRHEGRVHAALRHDTTGDWEYVIYEPSKEELAAVAETLKKHPKRRLTAFNDSVDDLLNTANEVGLQVSADDEVLMVTELAVHDVEVPLPSDGFVFQIERDGTHAYVSLHPEDNQEVVAASGHVSAVDGFAIFDRIITGPDFRRQGLGTLIMRALASLAQEHDVDEGLLIASVDGQQLYASLGWTSLGKVVLFKA